MIRTWSFCKACGKYHIDYTKNDLDINFETHLTESEKEDAASFPIYKKQVRYWPTNYLVPGLFIVMCDPQHLKDAMILYPSGFYDVPGVKQNEKY